MGSVSGASGSPIKDWGEVSNDPKARSVTVQVRTQDGETYEFTIKHVKTPIDLKEIQAKYGDEFQKMIACTDKVCLQGNDMLVKSGDTIKHQGEAGKVKHTYTLQGNASKMKGTDKAVWGIFNGKMGGSKQASKEELEKLPTAKLDKRMTRLEEQVGPDGKVPANLKAEWKLTREALLGRADCPRTLGREQLAGKDKKQLKERQQFLEKHSDKEGVKKELAMIKEITKFKGMDTIDLVDEMHDLADKHEGGIQSSNMWDDKDKSTWDNIKAVLKERVDCPGELSEKDLKGRSPQFLKARLEHLNDLEPETKFKHRNTIDREMQTIGKLLEKPNTGGEQVRMKVKTVEDLVAREAQIQGLPKTPENLKEWTDIHSALQTRADSPWIRGEKDFGELENKSLKWLTERQDALAEMSLKDDTGAVRSELKQVQRLIELKDPHSEGLDPTKLTSHEREIRYEMLTQEQTKLISEKRQLERAAPKGFAKIFSGLTDSGQRLKQIDTEFKRVTKELQAVNAVDLKWEEFVGGAELLVMTAAGLASGQYVWGGKEQAIQDRADMQKLLDSLSGTGEWGNEPSTVIQNQQQILQKAIVALDQRIEEQEA